jgi:hypothetical protein
MRLHAQWRIESIDVHSAIPKRSSSPSIRSNVISNGQHCHRCPSDDSGAREQQQRDHQVGLRRVSGELVSRGS